jgi:lipoprotein Spr
MNIQRITIGLIGLSILTSCKSLKSLTSKDTSSTQKQVALKHEQKNIAFLDNIEVTPGTVVTSRHKTINTASKKPEKKSAVTQTETQAKPDATLAKSNIENADYLQLKYAVILDATVEKLTNLPLLQTIDKWWGTPYCLGGSTGNCIDCSAFTQAVVSNVYNFQLPRTAQEQYNMAEHIDVNDLQEGDLVFFHTGGRRSRSISHVGFYLMNNKFVHASTSNGVTISDLNDNYWKQRFKSGGRIVK